MWDLCSRKDLLMIQGFAKAVASACLSHHHTNRFTSPIFRELGAGVRAHRRRCRCFPLDLSSLWRLYCPSLPSILWRLTRLKTPKQTSLARPKSSQNKGMDAGALNKKGPNQSTGPDTNCLALSPDFSPDIYPRKVPVAPVAPVTPVAPLVPVFPEQRRQLICQCGVLVACC